MLLRAAGMALAATAGIVLARRLGPSGYGIYSWAFAWVTALSVPAALGADQLLVREAAIALDCGDRAGLRSLVMSALRRVTFASLAVVLLVLVGFALFGGDPGVRGRSLEAALPILPLTAIAALAQGSLLGLGRTAAAVAPGTLGRQALFLGLAMISVLLGIASPTVTVELQLLATATSTIILLVLLRHALIRVKPSAPGRQVAGNPAAVTADRIPGDRATAAGERVGGGDWLWVSVPMGAAMMLLMVDAQVGLLVLGTSGDTSGAGVYAVALQCTAPFALLLSAGRLPLGGVVARLTAAGDRARLQRGLTTATRVVALASAAVAAILLLVPESVLDLFGNGFATGATTLRIVAVAQLVNAACAYNGLVLIMSGLQRVAAMAALGSLLVDAALCLVLVPSLGARGAALALLLSVALRNIVTSVLARARLGIDTTVLGRGLAAPRARS